MKKICIISFVTISNVILAVEYETDVDVSLIATYVKQSNNINNSYISELIRLNFDARFNDDFGCATNIVSDKRQINDKLTELNNLYGYYIFDKAGEIHFGHDRPIDQYIRVMEDNSIIENRNISGYLKLRSSILFNKYSIVDDHSCLKIMWMTPTFNGYKFGVSYAPNTSLCRGISETYTKDLISIGAMHNGIFFNKVPFGTSIIGYIGKSFHKKQHNVKSVMCEFYIKYHQLSINNRIVIDNSSLQSLDINNLDALYYSNIQYTIKKLKLSLGYLTSCKTVAVNRFRSKAYTASILYKANKFDTFINFKHLHTKETTGNSFSIGITKKFSATY